GPVTGTTVSVHFLNEGLVHLHLQAFTSADSFHCRSECELRIHSAPPPPCGPLAGDDATCVGVLETYTSPVLTAQYMRRWFVTDPGCRLEGSGLGAWAKVRFTGMGPCRVQQLVVDRTDSLDCRSTCSFPVAVAPAPPCNVDGDSLVCVGNTKT